MSESLFKKTVDAYYDNIGQPFVNAVGTAHDWTRGFLGMNPVVEQNTAYWKGNDAAIGLDGISAAALPTVGLPPVPVAGILRGAAKVVQNSPEVLSAIAFNPLTSKALKPVLNLFDDTAVGYAVREAKAQKGKNSLVFMRPDDFLSSARNLEQPDEKKLESIRNALDNNQKLDSLPELQLILSKDQNRARVLNHEGRHRALVFKERGIPFMPVKIINGESVKGNDIFSGFNYRNLRNEDVLRLPSVVRRETGDMKTRPTEFLLNPFLSPSMDDLMRYVDPFEEPIKDSLGR